LPLRLPPGLMVGVSGFRGRVGAPFTPELAAGLAAAYGTFLAEEGEGGAIFVGRDSRVSGPMLAGAAAAGLISVGREVVDAGVVSTPTLLLAAADAGAAGAVAVTASHNPAEWNAFKFATGRGAFLSPKRMERFLAFLAARDPRRAAWDALRPVRRDPGASERHVARILGLPQVYAEQIRGAGLAVALDCVNGAGGVAVPGLLERLGCSVRGIGLEPHGRFPRDPEPTAANLRDLGELVTSSNACAGLAVDPDADRLSLVDEKGRPLGEDLTLAIAADVVLARERGPVATNLSTSRVIEDVAESRGSRVLRAPVGEANVAWLMEQAGAVVGGEGNGGVILPALHPTRDALVGIALTLQFLALEPETSLSERVARWPAYVVVKEKAAFPRQALPEAFEALERELPPGGAANRDDGLRVEWPERREWIHVRPSGTEPVVRLIAEGPAPGEDARALVDHARAVLSRIGGG